MSGNASHQPQQRIRVGLTGLAFVFLLVILGAAISRSTGESPANGISANQLAGAPNEPLAEIGAAPGQSQGNAAAETANQAAP